MPRFLILFIAAIVIFANFGFSQSYSSGNNFGLGFVLGEPTALSAKYWTSGTTALDFGLGWGSGYWNNHRNGYFSDGRCYDGGFYNNNRGYCADRSGGYRYNDFNSFHFHMDYLFHNFNVIRSSERFPLFFGPGVSLNHYYDDYYDGDDTFFGIRGVFGIAWIPRAAPVDVFLELAPVLNLFPGTGMDVNAGLGARWFF